jgi:ketosteroid isomerase-like protein
MTLEEIEKRLKTLEDLEAIRKMHHDYIYALASQQWDDMLACFTEDAVADIYNWGIKHGKKEIEQLFKGQFNGKILPTHGHLAGQPVIKVDGNKAEGHWILYMFLPEPQMRFVQGRHDVQYVKENGQWKFKYLKFTRPWPEVK